MIAFQEAYQLAIDRISKNQMSVDEPLIIIEDLTIEKEYAWIFSYTSEKFWETRDFKDAIGGNGPLFISKVDGQDSHYRTGLTLEEMINEHEEKNGVWLLALTDYLFTDTKKALFFRQTLALSITEIAGFKNHSEPVVTTGSRERLEDIQKHLQSRDIATSLKLKEL